MITLSEMERVKEGGVSGILFVRARLAAGEPEEAIVASLLSYGWSSEVSAEAWVRKIASMPRPTFEHPNITKSLMEKIGSKFGTCGTCGVVVDVDFDNEGQRCNLCWEIEKRLDQYLSSVGARAHVRRKLTEHETGSCWQGSVDGKTWCEMPQHMALTFHNSRAFIDGKLKIQLHRNNDGVVSETHFNVEATSRGR